MDAISVYWTSMDEPCEGRHVLPAGMAGVQSPPAPAARRLQLGLAIELPIDGISGIWMPYGDRATMQKVAWHGELTGTPCFRPAVIAFVDADLRNRLAVAAGPYSEEITITWHLDQAAACYRIQLSWPDAPDAAGRDVWFSTAPESVYDVIPALLDAEAPVIPASAPHLFEPSYCTWYAYHGALDQRNADLCAERVKQLGFGTLIMDDGWAYDRMQRVGAVLGPWHQFNGDFTPSRTKFPAFGEHVAHVKALGLRYILWVAPFIVGKRSKSYKRLRPHLLPSWLDEGFLMADPRSEEAVASIITSLVRLLNDYQVDGFKVDYDYALLAPKGGHNGAGPAYAEATARIIRALQAINPAFEYNLIPNAFARTVTNAFRCVDVPFDADSNRLFMANLSALTPGAALYSDPALWSAGEPVETVVRHIVPSLFIVPSIGAPIMELPPAHLEAIHAWLGLYRRHQQVLNHGQFARTWAAGDVQAFSRRLDGRRITAAFSRYPVELDPAIEHLLINGSAGQALTVTLPQQAWLTLERTDETPLSPVQTLPAGMHNVSCPSGGVVRVMF